MVRAGLAGAHRRGGTFCKVTKEAPWEGFSFPESRNECFSYPEKHKRTVFMLLFRLYEKVTKKYTRGLRPSGLPGDGSKFRAWKLLVKPQAVCLSRNFYENLQPCAIQLGNILNRCERVTLLRKDLWVFLKRQGLIWADSRLCVLWNGWFWWKIAFKRTESCFWKNGKFCEKVQKPNFLHTCKTQLCSKLSPEPTLFPFSTATKITCTFPFNQLLAAASLHRNFDFSQKPILRLYHSSPFAPVQSLKAVLGTNRFNS